MERVLGIEIFGREVSAGVLIALCLVLLASLGGLAAGLVVKARVEAIAPPNPEDDDQDAG